MTPWSLWPSIRLGTNMVTDTLEKGVNWKLEDWGTEHRFPGTQLLPPSGPRGRTVHGKFCIYSLKHLLGLSPLAVYTGHFQTLLLCRISGELGAEYTHWGEEESSGRIRKNDVRVLLPPITRTPGVWHQEGL